MSTVRLNLGKDDGLRAAEIGRLVRELSGLKRRDISRISVREDHTRLRVASDAVDALLAELQGQKHGEKGLVVEVISQ
jgi:hypothetical protein